MSSIWQKAMYFLGLDDESRELDDREVGTQPDPAIPVEGGPRGRRVEPPSTGPWRTGAEAQMDTAGAGTATTVVRPVPGVDAESEILLANSFADAQELADHLRVRRAVVLDLRETEPDTVRRLVDFASGITYALDGTMQKIAQGVILVSPNRVALGEGERQRLTELGLYQLDL